MSILGVLLTFRHSESAIRNIDRLVDSLLSDPSARLVIVIATDSDDNDGLSFDYTDHFQNDRILEVVQITNDERDVGAALPICDIWNHAATAAFSSGADWVVFLGDDVELEDGARHHSLIETAFKEVQSKFEDTVPLGFGCVWFDDRSFPNFPTFPVIGRVHFDIMGGRLFPASRHFVNQDLDPYLHRLYLEFDSSPRITGSLHNRTGGGNKAENPPRYSPVHVPWKDWIPEDVSIIKKYLQKHGARFPDVRLVDIVVPSYRIPEEKLNNIVKMVVPPNWRTVFLIVLDNPDLTSRLDGGPEGLERRLSESSGHNVRVRANKTNIGASGTRNRGIRESAATWILFLDDDTHPVQNLLLEYEKYFAGLTDIQGLAGLIGLVQFPRGAGLSLMQGAVLMSYLTYAFEIAISENCKHPAWGVTANILMRRLPEMYFDTRYAKQGGGEDVDMCLRVGVFGRFDKVPSAIVHHPFWESNFYCHFFGWASGDGALFSRFPQHTYMSFPNVCELLVLWIPFVLVKYSMIKTVLMVLTLLAADVIVDMLHLQEFSYRADVLRHKWTCTELVVGHCIANSYIWVLEFGRLLGHMRRLEPFNLCRRFDWHCGKVEGAHGKFVRTELIKFCTFVMIIFIIFWTS